MKKRIIINDTISGGYLQKGKGGQENDCFLNSVVWHLFKVPWHLIGISSHL